MEIQLTCDFSFENESVCVWRNYIAMVGLYRLVIIALGQASLVSGKTRPSSHMHHLDNMSNHHRDVETNEGLSVLGGVIIAASAQGVCSARFGNFRKRYHYPGNKLNSPTEIGCTPRVQVCIPFRPQSSY